MSAVPAKSASQLRLRVTATAESLIRQGHPWLFDNSIRDQNREGVPGDLAVIYDRADKFLAIGFYDPTSPIRVRILHKGKPTRIDSEWWSRILSEAISRRAALFDETTTGFRYLNGESDGWPALVMDRYDRTLVVKLYSAVWLDRFPEILQLIVKALSPERVVLRLSRNIRAAAEQRSWTDGQSVWGAPLEGTVVFLENGIRFEADVLRGQKTGFFLDQRENRRMVETLTKNKTVLNGFSFSGGFSLYAARGGARSVTDLDISAHALESARRNFALNADVETISRAQHTGIQADVFEWLQKNENAQFDVVILDPPSLAKRESERADAIRAYEKLAGGGINHLRKGGILVAASCSAHVSSQEFFQAVKTAARRSGRNFEELLTTGHAPDHKATFKEAEYLKGIYLKFA